jgi:hypothetical protein
VAERSPSFDPLPGEIIGIADHLGWPIEFGEDVYVHFDGPNHRVVVRAKTQVPPVSEKEADERGC